jgi:hypothetical protein
MIVAKRHPTATAVCVHALTGSGLARSIVKD